MVPVAKFLHVPGILYNTNKLIIDLGINFFIEKTKEETNKLLDRKLKLSKNMAKTLGNLYIEKQKVNYN